MTTTIAGQKFEVNRADVEQAADHLEPEPIDVWFAVVGRRRYPPKQVIEAVTGLDRADFNSHQARALLTRLGFAVARRRTGSVPMPTSSTEGDKATALDDYAGRWVAQDGSEVLFDASSPQEVARWLHRHRRRARVWKVPSTPAEVGSMTSVAG